MTQNQIAYQNLLETKRSNLVKENETSRHNQADEYNRLIRATSNPFSLISHFAGGEQNAGRGVLNILKNAFGYDSNTGIQITNDKRIGTQKEFSDQYGQDKPTWFNRGPGNRGYSYMTPEEKPQTLFY